MKILVSIDEETKDYLEFLVEKKGMTQSSAVRIAIKDYYENLATARPKHDPYLDPYIDEKP